MKKSNYYILDKNGNVVEGASVTVYQAGTSILATLFSDNGSTVTPNPLTSSSLGLVSFYVTSGLYDVEVSGTGVTTQTLTNILISDLGVGGATITLRFDDPNTSGWGWAEDGTLWYNRTEHQLKGWNGSEVVLH